MKRKIWNKYILKTKENPSKAQGIFTGISYAMFFLTPDAIDSCTRSLSCKSEDEQSTADTPEKTEMQEFLNTNLAQFFIQ